MPVEIQQVVLLSATEVTTGEAGLSTVGEPTVANNGGGQILMAGNWYAARSLDAGTNWEALDPYNYLNPGPSTSFCCDQTVFYDAAHDLTVWLLQYERNFQDKNNTLRIAVKRGATLEDDDWFWWDFKTTTVDPTWTREWFDYNHVAATAENLFIGSNVYGIGKSIFRSVILRIPFASIVAAIEQGSALEFHHFVTGDSGTLRCALGAADTMYFGGQSGNDTIRLFSWPDASTDVTTVDIPVSPWLDSSYSAPGPDMNNWLSRCDDRITGAWVANGTIGLMWSGNRIEPRRPWPYVRVVLIDEAMSAVTAEPDIWSADFAYAYPDACPNDDGVVGVTLYRGGGATAPGHVIGVFEESSRTWDLRVAVDGTNGPAGGKWGDYITCRRQATNGASWIAAGFTLQNGTGLADIQPNLVLFGLTAESSEELT